MSWRCFLRRSSLVTPRSLEVVSLGSVANCATQVAIISSDDSGISRGCKVYVRHLQNQGCLPPRHLGLESALVVTTAQRAAGGSRSPQCYESGTALWVLALLSAIFNSDNASAIFPMRMDVRRRRLRQARYPKPRATFLSSLAAVAAADRRTAAEAECRWRSAGWGRTSMNG